MVVFKLINAAMLLAMAFVLPAACEHIGDCHENKFCTGKVLSSVSGDPKPGNEFKINGACPGFRSDVGSPYKMDLCTASSCSRLNYNQCYNSGGYQYVEVLQPGVAFERDE